MKLILSRHGQTIWNTEFKMQGRTNIPLNETGKQQALCLAKRLEGMPFTHIFHSPLSRAEETARLIIGGQAVPVEAHDALIERDFGSWEGHTFEELEKTSPEAVQAWRKDPFSFTPPNAEPLLDVYDRCTAFYQELVSRFQREDSILIVGHFIPLKLLIAHMIGLPPRQMHTFQLDNASYSELRIGKLYNMLRVLNDTCHLKECVCG